MDQIRIVKDDNENVFISQEDLLKALNERLEKFPEEREQLKKPKEGSIVGLDGNVSLQQPDEKEIARNEGMEAMLRGVINILNPEGENNGK